MFLKVKKRIGHHLMNLLGWSTERKIIVIESDDWGAIRMPSKEVYEYCLEKGYRVDLNSYTKYDCLENEEDLGRLFEVLRRHRDRRGNPAVMTANTVVANPDFAEISACRFQQYHYEIFTNTLKRRDNNLNCFDMREIGRKEGVFHPQFHAREHINVARWMRDLSLNETESRFAFDLNMAGIFPKSSANRRNKYVVALGYDQTNDWDSKAAILAEGLDVFEHLFHFRSKSFIAPNYVWDRRLEVNLQQCGVKYIQGVPYQLEPRVDKKNRKIYRYTGQQNGSNQFYLVRNCYFEPALRPSKRHVVDDCLKRIEIAFKWGKPAIICSHRLNYIGSIDPTNREENLTLLNDLLGFIVKKWPEVEFLSSDQLGDIMSLKGEQKVKLVS